MHFLKSTLFLFIFLTGVSAQAQTFCPQNAGFENGNFTNWILYTGYCCPISANTNSGPITNRHTITNGSGVDPYGGFPVVAPGGGNYSMKLGNSNTGSQAEKARYYVHVPSGVNNYSLIYRYAVVFEDPNHLTNEQPRFEVKAFDSATNVVLPCAQFTYIASSNLPGFQSSTSNNSVKYKTWTTATLNLSGWAGHTIAVEFATGDCSLGAHFGYGYVDMSCGLFQVSGTACGSPTTTFTAPPGFQSYTWMDSSYTNTVGSGQVITINTPPNTSTYHVILTPYSGFGCPDTLTTVLAISTLQVNATPDTTICSGNITLSAGATGNMAPFTYNWSPSTGLSCTTCANPVATVTGNSTYYVTVTDTNGCSKMDTVNINTSIFTLSTTHTNVACMNGNNGSATVNVTGSGTYTYSWNTIPVQTTQTATNLTAGTYIVTVTNTIGCSKNDTVTITQPTALSASASPTPVNCYGQNNGAATVSVSGGTSPYTYSWNTNPIQTTQTAGNIIAGTYTVTVTDAHGCTTTASTTVTQPTQLLAGISGTTNALCGNPGTASVGVTGGSPGYSYVWSTIPVQTTQTATNLGAGTFTVTVTDSHGCTDTAATYITQSSALSVSHNITNTTCSGTNNGSITANVSGGTGPYTYSWNTIPVQTTQTANNLPAGTYVVTVTDNTGCTKLDTATVTAPQALSASASHNNVNCYGQNNGSATVSVTGGTTPYTYSWNTNPVQSTQTATNVVAGTYTVTVTDANGCTTTASTTVGQPASLIANISNVVNAVCGNPGSASVTVSGGTPGYTYTWNTLPVQTTQTATNLSAGTYIVTVTDAHGCTDTSAATVIQSASLGLTFNTTSVSCNGLNNGSITAVPVGGSGPYTYTWNNQQTTQTISNLAPGTYSVTVVDNLGCTATGSATVTMPSALSATTSGTPVICNGQANGSATATGNGGTPPYTYTWNTNPVQTTQTATNLPAGPVTVTITDAHGCTATSTITITQPTAVDAFISYTNSPMCSNVAGIATVGVTGGTAPYTYHWNTIPVQTTATANNLPNGTYTATVTDAHGCTDTAVVVISQTPALILNTSVTNISCNGAANGSASVSASSGTPPYTYLWSNSQTGTGISNLGVGTYTVTVTDNGGCTNTTTVSITQPNVLNALLASQANVSCNGGGNGTANISVIGGTQPYSFLWNTNPVQTTTQATNLTAGTYTAVITDAHGCLDTVQAVITQPQPLDVMIAPPVNAICGQPNGSATATATGGTTPYNYAWSTLPVQTTATANNLNGGIYTVVVTDNKGCKDSADVTLTQSPAVVVTTTPSDVSCNGLTNGSVSATITGGTQPFTHNWNIGQTGLNITNLGTGNYTIVVTDNVGCMDSSTAMLTEPASLNTTTTFDNVKCYGAQDGSASVTVSGGTQPYNYLWSNGGTGANPTGMIAGTYSVVVTDAHGCSDTETVQITQPADLILSASTVTNSCGNEATGSAEASATGGTAPYNLAWSTTPPQSGLTASNLAPGSYSVVVTDANGCSKTALVNIDGFPLPTVDAGPDQVYCYGADSLVLTATGALTYLWSPSEFLECSTCAITGANPNTTTNFQVIGFDEHNCRDTDWVNVTVFLDNPAFVGNDLSICKGDKAQLTADGGVNYVWSPSPNDYEAPSSSPTASPESTTTYTVVITKNQCFTDTMQQKVTVFERPTIDLGPDQKVLPGTMITLHADTTNADGITWEPVTDLSCDDCINPSATVYNSITYVATVFNKGCKAQDDITITVACDGSNIFMANTFTPNNDGNNDVFYPQTPGMGMIKLFKVYNRWGQVLHEASNFPSNDPKYGWDGTLNGTPLSPDVYVYFLETSCPSGEKVFKKGDISLLK